ncbi:MAG TPA: DUF1329 domain-containing protein [Myxococcota bacterium]|nr:DUF1329 domain-containing protein [Myxococcota bacterium]
MPTTCSRLARLRLRWLAAASLALGVGAALAQEAPKGKRHEDAAVHPVPWTFPPIDSCQPGESLRGWPPGTDAPAFPFHTGDTFSMEELDALKDFLPPYVWEQRDRFFYEGMQLEIGRCFADYSPPSFYRAATAAHVGEPKLAEDGGLVDYTAGLPFPPDRFGPEDPEAGAKWAWNFELRYQCAGFWGDFRTSDMVGRDGRVEPFVGEIFRAQTAFRSDRKSKDYKVPGARGKHWVVGGMLKEPFDARHYSWRQYRDVDHMTDPDRSDDLHAYLPDYRRVRRVPASGIEGVYMPSFSVGVIKPSSISGLVGGAGSVGGAMAATITTKRSGFEGVELRPLLYEMRVLGVQDVLTPINARTPAYPVDENREFGPWGLSFASDRWDLRRAVVLEGRAKASRSGDQMVRFIQHVDAQNLVPLYYASWDYNDEPIDVGMFVGRWSEDREDYPRWPDDEKREVRGIDTTGAAFANLSVDGGWRRESWEMICIPPKDAALKRDLSVTNLTKRR